MGRKRGATEDCASSANKKIGLAMSPEIRAVGEDEKSMIHCTESFIATVHFDANAI